MGVGRNHLLGSTGKLFHACVLQHWQNVSACAIHRTCTKLFLKRPAPALAFAFLDEFC